MGNWNSGRRTNKACTESLIFVDVRDWQRKGLLTAECQFMSKWSSDDQKVESLNVTTKTGQIIFHHSKGLYGSNVNNQTYSVYLTTTSCHYGGERLWFICPVSGCSRRVALLYSNDIIFACRHCLELKYRSQSEASNLRAIRRADKIKTLLGWQVGIQNNHERYKPKGMHWRSFNRLKTEYEAYLVKSLPRSLVHPLLKQNISIR